VLCGRFTRRLLVTQIVDSFWRMQRAELLETAALESEIGWHESTTDALDMFAAWRAAQKGPRQAPPVRGLV
jgi:hypothetical protein